MVFDANNKTTNDWQKIPEIDKSKYS